MPDEDGMDEWKEARAVIGRFDDNLHDLRKYGFSFVTALLTADAILGTALPSASTMVPGYLKLGVLLVTLGLFVSLRLLDQHYRLFQQAASRRATVLERRLNAELTRNISFYYGLSSPGVHWWKNMHWFYNGFLVLTAGLGVAILVDVSHIPASAVEISVFGLGILVAYILMRRISQQVLPKTEDWTIDKRVIQVGDTMRIGWTHFGGRKKGEREKEKLEWRVVSQSTWKTVKSGSAEVVLDNARDTVYDWLWESVDAPQGLYQFEEGSENSGTYVFTIQITGAEQVPGEQR